MFRITFYKNVRLAHCIDLTSKWKSGKIKTKKKSKLLTKNKTPKENHMKWLKALTDL